MNTLAANKEKAINPTFRILSAIAIVLVVAGHADFGIFDLGGLFPYYSFHVAVFAFISGYFYREQAKEAPFSYLKKKACRLMLPYFGWNLVYGLLVQVLRAKGFNIGSPIGIRTLLIEPFLGGHQFGLNFASWFVPMLFIIEAVNLFMRKILLWLHLNREGLILAVSLLGGMLAVWLSMEGKVWGYYRTIGCLMLLYPIYQWGQFYRVYLEKRDILSNGPYFLLVCGLQFLLLLVSKGRVAYSTVWCSGFVNGPLLPFLTAACGIAFWLRIARILSPLWKKNGAVDRIGENTFAIMMHHVLGFMLVNTLFFLLSISTLLFADFDGTAYLNSYEYRYLPMGLEIGKWLYLLAGICFPLFLQKSLDFIRLKHYSEKVVRIRERPLGTREDNER